MATAAATILEWMELASQTVPTTQETTATFSASVTLASLLMVPNVLTSTTAFQILARMEEIALT